MAKQIIWTTKLVDEAIEKIGDGYVLKRDDNPFFQNIVGLRRAGLTFKMTPQEIEEYTKCSFDIEYFAEKYCYVKGEDGQPFKIKLRDYQKEMLNNLINFRRNIWMCSRQTGKTICSIIRLLHFANFQNNKNVIVTANRLDTVSEIITKMQEIYQNLPFFLQMGVKNQNQKAIILENKSRIKGFTTTKTSSVGNTADAIYMDEFAHIQNNIKEKFYKSVFPTVANIDDSMVIISSTPDGFDLFHRLLTDAENGNNNFKPLRVYWWQVPKRFVTYIRLDPGKLYEFKINKDQIFNYLKTKYAGNDVELYFNNELKKDVINIYNNEFCSEDQIQKEEIDGRKFLEFSDITTWKKETIKDIGGEEAFNQEFDLRFVNSAKNLLDESLIEDINKNKKDYIFSEIDEFEKRIKFSYRDLLWISDEDVFKYEDRKKYKIIMSIDISEGLAQDYSVINIFKLSPKIKELIEIQKESYKSIVDFFKLDQIGIYRSNITSVQQLADIVYILGFEYFDPENVKIVLEINTYGNELLGYMPQVFDGNNNYGSSIFFRYKHRSDATEEKIGLKIGDNKNLLVKEYQDRMQNRSINITNEANIYEITTFIKQVTSAGNIRYAADGNSHDDTIMTVISMCSIFDKVYFKQMVEDFSETIVDKEFLNYIKYNLKEIEQNTEPLDYKQVLDIRKKQILQNKTTNQNWTGENRKDWYGRPNQWFTRPQ